MIADLKPYAEYKESGLPWLGPVPGHWEVRQARHIGRLLKGVGGTKEDSVPDGVPCVRYGELYTTHTYFIRASKACIRADRAAGYTPIQYGDVLFAASGETIEEIGKSAVNLMQTAAVCGGDVIVLRPGIPVHAPFLGYAMDCRPATNQKATMGRGTTVKHIYPDELRSLLFPLPTLDEQAAIARFLDWANGRLERAIRAKRKVIALLNEQKQAIIHRAVTRGLDPSVPLKPSGVPWLGDIPQHWEIISLRMRYRVELGKMLDAKRITGRHSIPYLRNRDVQWDTVLTDDLPVMDIPPSEIARYTVKRGDLLVCEGGQVGRSAFWDEQLPVCGFQKALHRVRCLDGRRDYVRFFFYQMHLATGRGVFSADGNENTIAHLTCENLRRHRFAFPPFAEQAAVADRLDGEVRRFQIALSRLEREIELLREYRTCLIADVVTGKLDVREAAAQLPVEVAPGIVKDDADLSDDPEAADEEALV